MSPPAHLPETVLNYSVHFLHLISGCLLRPGVFCCCCCLFVYLFVFLYPTPILITIANICSFPWKMWVSVNLPSHRLLIPSHIWLSYG